MLSLPSGCRMRAVVRPSSRHFARALEALVSDGLVDRERIGILGWSATGERALNMLTFPDVPIRAASLLDGDANTLFSMTVTYAARDGIQGRKDATNESAPYGESLARWVLNDPSLHTDCVKAAIRWRQMSELKRVADAKPPCARIAGGQ